MKGYFLGVDIGGTKSHALIADENGKALALGINGPGNHQTIGYEQMVKVMKQIVGESLNEAHVDRKDLSAAGFGIAGYDWMRETDNMMQSIDQLGLSCPLEVVNDTLVGLVAGAAEGWGVGVVSGTGCNCWGWNHEHKVGRVTGYGSWMAEGAGGTELVEQAVHAVSMAWSRRGEPTALSNEMVNACGAKDLSDLIEGFCLGQYYLDADFAPRIFSCAEAGDKVAGEIIHWAGCQLGNMAVGVIRQLGFESIEFEVILVGSMFDGGPVLIDPMRETVKTVAPKARLVRLTTLPVVGGVLLGMDKIGKRKPGVRENLINTTNQLLRE